MSTFDRDSITYQSLQVAAQRRIPREEFCAAHRCRFKLSDGRTLYFSNAEAVYSGLQLGTIIMSRGLWNGAEYVSVDEFSHPAILEGDAA